MDGGTKLERVSSGSSSFRLLQLTPIEAKDEWDEVIDHFLTKFLYFSNF